MRSPVEAPPQAGALTALARRHGVLTEYRAADGRRRAVDPDVVVAVLGALGVDLPSSSGAAEAWRQAEVRRADRVLAPTVVHRQGTGEPAAVTVDLPPVAGAGPVAGQVSVVLEGGGRLAAPLRELLGPALGGRIVDGRRRARHTLSLARLGPLPLGYHRLTVEAPGASGTTTVVVAPRHCPRPPKTWGLGAPAYALRGSDDWGAGGLRELGELADWSAGFGAGLTGTLPLYAAFLQGPQLDPSPYRPASRLAWNEALVDMGALADVADVPAAADALASADRRRRAAALAAEPLVDLPAVLSLKWTVLAPLAAAVLGGQTTTRRRAAFDRWATAHPDAVAYARFRATGEVHPGTDRPGPPIVCHPDRPVEAALATWCYAQWVADEQLAALGRRRPLYLDVPVGVHPDGFDPRWEPAAYVQGASIGAPPDAFFAGGQDWGLPPPHPEGSRTLGHRHLAAVLRQAMARAAVVRLDHVMGLHRLWFVPAGAPPTAGAYVRYPADELRAVVALEAHRAGTAVVGEDLGTVPVEVRRGMAEDGMLRSAVWQFDASPDDPFPAPPVLSLASLGTHDLPTFASFLGADDDRPDSGPVAQARDVHHHPREATVPTAAGIDHDDGAAATTTETTATPNTAAAAITETETAAETANAATTETAAHEPSGRGALRQAVGPDLADALRRCLTHLAASPALVVQVDLADLWLETEPQNVPGTGPAGGSFRRRARRSLAELATDPAVTELLRAVDRARRTGTADRPRPADRGQTPARRGEPR